MKKRKFTKTLTLLITFAMLFMLAVPTTAFADDETTPAAEETTEEPVAEEPIAEEAPSGEETTEEPAVEEPAVEEAPAAEETTEEPAAEEPAVEEAPAAEEDLSDIVAALDEADVVLVDEGGEPIPLASEEAVEALETSDPFYMDTNLGAWVGYDENGNCPTRVNPVNCHTTATPVQDAVDGAIAAGAVDIYIVTGDSKHFNENLTLSSSTNVFSLYAIKNAWDAGAVKTSGVPTGYATINSISMSSDASLFTVFAPIIYINPGASIQDGVDAVLDGGTVNVAAGTYSEQVKINKSVSLQGAGKESTTIVPDPVYFHCWGPPCGPGDRTLVEINGGDENASVKTINVLLDGFTIDGQYMYGNKFGVLVHGGAFAEISNNNVKNFYDDALHGGNQVNVLAGYWGQDWPWSGSAGVWKYTGHAYMHDNIVSGFNTVGMMIWGQILLEQSITMKSIRTQQILIFQQVLWESFCKIQVIRSSQIILLPIW